jgi:eukaryotic-like serine/threonine-protein kinase
VGEARPLALVLCIVLRVVTGLAIEPNTRIGRYRVIRALGRGGMAGVFEVEDDAGGRFALKAPITDVNAGGDATRRFAREASALRMLDHENLVRAVDVFVEAGVLCLVMEKVEGPTLGQALIAARTGRASRGPLAPRRALVMARQILDGVSHAHAHALVHRDLKPDNILLLDMGGWERVKIIDFGIVKLLGDAPYAAGVMLFEMLTGRLPFHDPDPLTMMTMHTRAPVPRIDQVAGFPAWATPAVCALVEGALVKDPAHRFPTASVMIAALDDAFYSIDHL